MIFMLAPLFIIDPQTRIQLYCIQSNMESQPFEKQMFSTNRKQKIFNVRKVPYKQFDNQKYLKSNFSPFQKKQMQREPSSSKHRKHLAQPKKGDYLALTATPGPYKEINKKYIMLKEQLNAQKQRRLQKLKEREQELNRIKIQNERLNVENQKLLLRREEIKAKLDQLRERNQIMRQEQIQRNEEIRMMNMEYLRNMVIGMRYQNGVQIDTDNMTYEELLELEEKIGKVSKGITQQQFNKIKKIDAKGIEEVCSVCYCNIKEGEEINQLPCKHCYHVDCIKEWLLKQRTCPLCKQQIFERAQEIAISVSK